MCCSGFAGDMVIRNMESLSRFKRMFSSLQMPFLELTSALRKTRLVFHERTNKTYDFLSRLCNYTIITKRSFSC